MRRCCVGFLCKVLTLGEDREIVFSQLTAA
jgi:hypothetical protein